MKKNAAFAVTTIIIALFVAGCSQSAENEKKHANHQTLDVLQVEIAIKNSPANINEKVIFEARVTQGDEPVEDAKEVEFEFGREGDSDTEIIKVKNQDSGVYQLEKSFSEDGIYTITAHVTARDMHSMPSKEFEITP